MVVRGEEDKKMVLVVISPVFRPKFLFAYKISKVWNVFQYLRREVCNTNISRRDYYFA